jgi:hypothetical protein
LTGFISVAVVGAAAGVVVAAAAGVATLEMGVAGSAAKTRAEVNDKKIKVVAIVFLNFMVDCPSFFPF